MFFDRLASLPALAEKVNFSIFILENSVIDSISTSQKKRIKTAMNQAPFEFPPTTFYLEPEKNSIKVDQIRTLAEEMLNKQTEPRFFVIKHAEKMNEQAENAALKLLEEPQENCHLVFLATSISAFLPTILSRAALYILKTPHPLENAPSAPDDILENARLLLSSSPKNTFTLITRWTDKKAKKDRTEILQILSTAIEIAYKSYFKTENPKFLKKIPSLLTAYTNIQGNGHIRLQLTAHLC